MHMAEIQSIRFSFSKIIIDEFALTADHYDQSVPTTMQLGLGFNFVKEETSIGVQAKCMFYQEQKLLIVIAVSCWFKIIQEDWDSIYKEEDKIFALFRPHALHLACLTVSRAW